MTQKLNYFERPPLKYFAVLLTDCYPNRWKVIPGNNSPSNYFSTLEEAYQEAEKREKYALELGQD